MCDDTKWASSGPSGASGLEAQKPAIQGGKPSGIRGADKIKICPQLDRGKWHQRLPRGHDEDTCHMVSQKRRCVLQMMKKLVDAHVNRNLCPEWDTSETCENTPGPYRFGVYKPGFDDNYKIVYSQLTKAGCECIKRNGLQDDCRLLRCRGSPACKVTPFPRCEPFLGIPAQKSELPGGSVALQTTAGDNRRCPASPC